MVMDEMTDQRHLAEILGFDCQSIESLLIFGGMFYEIVLKDFLSIKGILIGFIRLFLHMQVLSGHPQNLAEFKLQNVRSIFNSQ